MNKVYKIVWNASLGAWVAVSELAKSKTKTKTVGSASLFAAMIVFAPSAFASYSAQGSGDNAASASGSYATAIGNSATASAQSSSAYGSGAKATGFGSAAFGNDAKATGNNSFAAGGGQNTGTGATASGTAAISIGYLSTAVGDNSTAIGLSANAANRDSVAIGNGASTANSSGTGNAQSVAIGPYTIVSGDQSVGVGNNVVASGNSSIAVGGDDIDKVRSASNSTYKTITGVDLPTGYNATKASGGGAVALGAMSQATGNFASSYGMASNATGDASVALGTTANASGQGALAIGAVSNASQTGSVAIGINSKSAGLNSTAIGSGSSSSTGSQATGDNATAIGGGSTAATNGTALGTQAVAKEGGTAIGTGAQATKAGGVAIGSNSISSIDAGVAGYDPITGQGSTNTTNVWKSTNAAVAVGSGSTVSRQITGVAAGTNDVDAVNVAQLKATKNYTDNVAKSTATALGGSSALDQTTGQVTTPRYTITKTDGTQTTVNGVENAFTTLNTEVVKPITFKGNSGSSSNQLGSTLTISGGSTADSSNSNVKTVVSGNTVDVQIANAPIFTGEVTAKGFDATGNTIANVKAGVADTDAVNVSQLTSTSNNLTNKGLNFTDNNGTITHKNLGETLTIKGTGNKADDQYNTGNIKTTTDSNGNIVVGIDQNSNFQTVKATDSTTGNNSVVSGTGTAITSGDQKTTANYDLTQAKLVDSSGNSTTTTASDNVIASSDNKTSTKTTAGNTAYTDGTNNVSVGNTGLSVNNGTDSSTVTATGLTVNNGPSVTTTGINAADMKITKVAAGTADTDAVNVSQLTSTSNALTNRGFNITANGSNSDNVKLGETVNFTNTDGNLVASNSDNQVTYNLSKNINVDTVKAGNTSIDTNGVSVTDPLNNSTSLLSGGLSSKDSSGKQITVTAAGVNFRDQNGAIEGPSITRSGIDAGSQKITSIAAGTADTDAVNVSQLTSTSNSLTSKGLNFKDTNGITTHKNLGETLTIKGTGNKADDQYNTGNIKTTTDSNGNIVVGIDQNSNFQTVKATDSTTGNNSVVSGTGTAITSGDQKTTANYDLTQAKLVDSSGNSTTTTASDNVIASSDNKTSTKTTAGNTAYTDGTNNVSVGNTGLSVNNGTDSSTVTATGLTVNNGPSVTTTGINAADMKITKVAAGTADTDAVNVSQLTSTSNALINKGLSFAGDSGTDVARKLGDTLNIKGGADSTKLTDNNIGVVANGTDGLEVKLAKDLNLGKDGSVTAGNTALNNDGIVTTDAAGNTATLSGSGTNIQGKDGSSANYALAGTTLKDTSGNTNSTTPTSSTLTDKTGNNSETTAAGTTVTTKDANGNTTGQTNYGADGFSIKDGPSVGKDGINAANTVISNVKDGSNANDAANKGQVDAMGASLTNKGLSFAGDSGTDVARKLGDTLNIKGGADSTKLTDNNIGVVANGTDGLEVKLAKDLNLGKDGSVTAGNTALNNDGIVTTDAAGNTATLSGSGTNIQGKDGSSANYALAGTTLKDTSGNTNSTTPTSSTLTDKTGNNSETTAAGTTVTTKDANGNTTGQTNYGADGFSIKDGPSVGKDGINAANTVISNVKDGSNANDAANKGQVDAMGASLTNKGLSFAGDSGTDVARKLGDTLNIKGGADSTKLTDNNIGVVANGTDGLEVKLAKDLNLGKDGSVTAGNTALNNDGIVTTDAAGNTATLSGSGTNIQGKDGSSANYALAGTTLKDTSGNTNSTTPTSSTLTDKTGNNSETTAAGTTVTTKDANGNTTGQTNYGADGFSIKDGPSVGKDGINAANTVISNVKDGSNANDAANKGQVDAMGASLTNKGLSFAGDSGTDVARKLGDTLNIKGGADSTKLTDNNIGVVANGTDGLEVKLAKDLNLGKDGSVTAGNTALNNDGIVTTDAAGNTATLSGSGTNIQGKDGSSANYALAGTTLKDTSGNTNSTTPTSSTLTDKTGNNSETTAAGTTVTTKDANGNTTGQTNYGADGFSIKDGPSVGKDGINAANTVISNVKDGSNANDAANKGQVDAMGASLTNKGLSFAGDSGTDVARKLGDTLNIKGGADSTKLTDNNIGVVANGTDGLEVKLAKDLNLGKDGSVTAGNTALNNDGIVTTDAAGNTATLSGSGTNIQGKDGSSANYALAGTTLKDTSGNTNSTTPTSSTLTDKTGNNSETTAAGTTVTTKDANGNTTGQTNYGADGFSIKDGPSVGKDGINAANTVISNVKDGSNANDAANKGQVDAMGASLTNKGLSFAGDSGTDVARKLGDTLNIKGGADSTKLTDNNIGVVANGTDGLEVKLAKDLNLGKDGSVTAGNTALNNDGIVTTDAAGNTATLSGSGTNIQGKDGSSANYALAGTTLKDTSGNTNSTTPTSSTLTDKTGNNSETTAAGTTVTTKDANGNTTGQTNYGADGFSIKDGPSVGKDGINAANTVISNVKDGSNANDAANKGQVDAMGASLTNKGLSFAGDSGTDVARKLGDTLNIKGGADSTKLTDNNIGVVANGTDGLEVKLAKDLNLGKDGSVTAGNTALSNNGLTINNGPSITTSGINAAGTKVTNVADGTDTQDAVNKGQLNNLESEVNNKFNDLSTKGSSTQDTSGNSSSTTASGTTVADKDGNTNTSTSTGNTVAGKDGNSTTTTADGTTSKDKDGNSTTTTAGGSTTQDQNGNSNTSTATNNSLADKDGNSNTSTATSNTVAGKDGNSTTTTADGTISKDKDGNSTTTTAGGSTTQDQNGNSNTSTATNNSLADKDGNSNTSTATSNTLAGKDGNSTTTTADGTTSKDKDGNSTTTTAGGSTTQDQNGNSNTSTATNNSLADKDGNSNTSTATSNTLAGKDGNSTTTTADGTTVKDKNGNSNTSTATSNTLTDGKNTTTTTASGTTYGSADPSDKTSTNIGQNGLSFTDTSGNKTGPSVTASGIDAGNEKITNVADGAVGPTSKDAVNGSQLYTATTDLTNKGLNFADSNGTVTHKNLGETLTIKGTGTKSDDQYNTDNLKTTTDSNGNIVVGLDKNASFNSLNVAGTTVNATGLTINNGPSITTSGINAAGTKVTNIADGTDTQDAVNKGQLNTLQSEMNSKFDNLSTQGSSTQDTSGNSSSTTASGTTVADKNGNSNISTSTGNTVAGKDGNSTTTTAGGTTTQDQNGNSNSSTATSNTLAGKDGNSTTTTADGTISKDKDGNSTTTTASGSTTQDQNGNSNTSTATSNTLAGKDGNSTTTTADGTISKDKDGNSTTTTASGSTTQDQNGNSNTSTATSNTLAGKDGNSTTTTADGTTVKDKNGNSNTSTATSNTLTDGKNTTTTTASGTTYGSADPSDKTSTNIGQNGLSFTDTSGNKTGPSVTASGIDAGNEKITNVADGAVGPTSKDAVNGSQLYTATTDLTNKGLNFADSNGTVTHKNLGETLTIKGTGAKSDDQYNTDNLKTTTDSNGNIVVGLDRNASFDSLALGGTTLNSSGLTINNGPSITASGINAAGTKVTNLANGTDAQDAVNKGQLDALATNISNNVTNVTDGNGNKVNVSNEVVNSTPNSSNTDSVFLTYDKTGQETTDRLTIGQTVQKMNTEGVKYSHTNGSTEVVDGRTNDSSAGGTNSTAIGVNSIIDSGADNTIALGKSTSASGVATNSVVIGNKSSVTGASSVAIGDGALASGTQSISVGTGNQVKGNHSGAFGDPSTITGNESYVLGNNNTVSTDNTFVVGNNVQATTTGSVVLGNNSAARTGANVSGYVPTGATSANQSAINATTSTIGAIAVGDAQNNVYRQITGVAAGTANSDAVNVAQLKAVDDKILALKTEGNTVSDSSGNTNVSNATGNIVSGNTNNGGTTSSNTTAAGTAVTEKDANGNVINNTATTASGVSVTGKDSNGNTTNANYGANDAKYTNADGSSTTVGGNGVSFADQSGNKTGPSITASGLDAGNQKVTNVADGTVSSTSKDAVNGSQLYSVQNQLDSLKTSGNNVTDTAGNNNQSTATGNTVKDASGNTNQATATSNTLSGKDASGNAVSSATTASGTTVTTKDSSGNAINNANYSSTQASLSDAKGNSATTTATGTTYTGADKTSSTVNNNGLSFKDASGTATGPSVTASGIDAGNQKVTNVTNGAVSSTSKDAVNGSQVYAANASVAAALGGSAAVNADGTVSSPSYKVANSSYNNVGEALTAVDNRVGNVENNLNQAFTYTNNRINKLEDKLSSGIAAAAALEQAPFVAGKWTYAAGASYYNNQGAIGATLRRTADNGRWSMTGGVAGGTNGSPLVRVGVSGVID